MVLLGLGHFWKLSGCLVTVVFIGLHTHTKKTQFSLVIIISICPVRFPWVRLKKFSLFKEYYRNVWQCWRCLTAVYNSSVGWDGMSASKVATGSRYQSTLWSHPPTEPRHEWERKLKSEIGHHNVPYPLWTVRGFFCCETGPIVCHPYPRRLESLNVWLKERIVRKLIHLALTCMWEALCCLFPLHMYLHFDKSNSCI